MLIFWTTGITCTSFTDGKNRDSEKWDNFSNSTAWIQTQICLNPKPVLYSTVRVFFFWDEGRKLKGGFLGREVGFKGKVGFWHWDVWNVNSNRTHPRQKTKARRERCRLCVKASKSLKPRQRGDPEGEKAKELGNRFQNRTEIESPFIWQALEAIEAVPPGDSAYP